MFADDGPGAPEAGAEKKRRSVAGHIDRHDGAVTPRPMRGDLPVFVMLGGLGAAASYLSVNIPHTDAFIEGRWAFGFMAFALLRRWWAAVLMACLLSVVGFHRIPLLTSFFGNMLYAVPALVLIRLVYPRLLAIPPTVTFSLFGRRLELPVNRLAAYGIGWFLLVMVCYEAFNTPILWALFAFLDGHPVVTGIAAGWREQPLLVEALAVASFSALAVSLLRSHGQVREGRQELATMLRSIGDAVIATDTACYVIRMNPVAEDLTGWQFEDARGRHLDEVLHIIDPDTRRHVRSPVARVLEQGVTVGLGDRTCLVGRDATEVRIASSAAPIRNEDGSIRGVILVFRDVTLEYEGREALRMSEEYQRALIQASPLAIFSLDREGNVLTWNAGAEEMLGWSSAEAIGRPLPIVPPDKQDEFAALRTRAFGGEAISGMRLARARKDGTHIHVSLSAALIRDGEGRVNSIMAALEDATAQARAEQREAHLKQVLLAIRDVNQLIADETDRLQLAQRACQALTATTGYQSAWIVLIDAAGQPRHVTSVGLGDGFGQVRSELAAGRWPPCMKAALASVGPVVAWRPPRDCPDCPAAIEHGDDAVLATALSFDGVDYGLLGVSLPMSMADDAEELGLFAGMAVDLSFALRKIEDAEALRESQRRYREVFEGSRDGFVIVDMNGRITDANSAFCEMLGYALDELRALDSFHTITPERWHEWEDREIWRGSLRRRGHSGVYEKEYIRKDGTIFPIELHAHAVKAADGQLSYVWGIARDITSRTQAAEQLHDALDQARRRQRELGWLLDASRAVVAAESFEDAARHIFDVCSEATGATSGYVALLSADGAESEVIFLEAGDLPCDVDPQLLMPIRGLRAEAYSLASVVYDNDFTNSEWSRFMPTGHVELRNVMFAPLIVAEKVVGMIGLANKPTDFTEQDADISQALADMAALSLRRTWDEQALRESEERFSLAFQTSPYAITITRVRDGSFVEVNDTFTSIIGYSREEAIGKTSHDLNIWADAHDRERLMNTLMAGERVVELEVALRAKDGRTVNTLFSTDLIRLGTELCILSSVSDITERVRAREEREHLQEQLLQAQKIESVGRLAGGVAHDLNNLLVPILGYSDMLLEDCPPDADTRAPLEAISHASTRARDLVQQLLAFSRKQVLEFVSIDINELLTRFERLLRSTIREDITIEFLLDDAVPLIRGDVGQLEQVVMNLAVNARDAMPNGGTLTIQTGVAELDDAYVASHPDAQAGRYVALSVTDTGAGMDEETREHIFEPFYTTKATPLGTGLGLATVYGIVKQHGGTIYVYSEPGHGATFRVYLPVSDQDAPPPPAPAVTPVRVHGAETILLVEDDEQVRELARSMLARQGYRIIAAAGGAEAISLMDGYDGTVDLLLTDVVMPEMSGKDLLDHLAATHPDLRVLYMSGYSDDVIAHRGVIDEGVNFIQKPFAVQALAARVREVLDQD